MGGSAENMGGNAKIAFATHPELPFAPPAFAIDGREYENISYCIAQ